MTRSASTRLYLISRIMKVIQIQAVRGLAPVLGFLLWLDMEPGAARSIAGMAGLAFLMLFTTPGFRSRNPAEED